MRYILLIPLIFLAACSQVSPAEQSTPTQALPLFATATLVPTSTPRPTATAATPTPVPTIAPITALLINQVNVRIAPNKTALVLGLLNYGVSVQVIGKDQGGEWWQIIYPENSAATAWVSMAYVQMAEEDAKKIPVARDNTPTAQPLAATSAPNTTPAAPLAASATPAAAAHTAKVKAQIYVRSGPAQTFESKGLLNAGAVVTLAGRSQNNVWIQILFDGGVDGKGWVAAAYLDGADLQDLPYFDFQGAPLGVGTSAPGSPSGQPTLTATAFSPAAADADSEKNPGVRIKFAPDSAREFTYSSDLSSPSGDGIDWVAFTPYEPTNQSTFVYFKLECSGNGAITATLEKDGLPVPDSKTLLCGNYNLAMKVLGGAEYVLVLKADGSGGLLRYVSYTLRVKSQP
jgi:uncharacterized protein YraI